MKGVRAIGAQREAVQRMQDFILKHLDEEIGPEELARASYFSPWHANRLFKKFTGFTPAEYVRRLRLSRSALLLRDSEKKIIEVAFEMGFGSVDGYQRAFFKEFGLNPSDYVDHPVPLYLFIPYRVENDREEEEFNMKETETIFVKIINKPRRKVWIKRGVKATEYFGYCEEVGCDIWGLLTSIKTPFEEPVSLWLPEAYIKPNTSKYVQGVEVPLDHTGIKPSDFDEIELPEAEYLLFQGEPFEEEDYGKAIESVWQAIQKYNPKNIGYEWDESNPRIQLEPLGERGYMELMPIKPVK